MTTETSSHQPTRPLLSAQELTVRRGGQQVLSGVSLDVAAGEVVAVLGPNGAGKSTLVDTISGVLTPAEGRVVTGGRVAAVMQSPGLARRSARANVELALAWWGVPRGERRARAMAALDQMGVSELSDRVASTLSGGERRRVHLARGIALDPPILLLDEPFAGLDVAAQTALSEDTARAVRTPSRAVLVVVHDRPQAWALADRIAVLFDGRKVADGPPAELLAAPPDAEVARFLGYNGALVDGDTLLLTRHVDVHLGEGDLTGCVIGVVPHEDAARVEVATSNGLLRALDPSHAVRLGYEVRVRVSGGVRFPLSQIDAPKIRSWTTT